MEYILVGHTPVAVVDTVEWAQWLRNAKRRVALSRVGVVYISTVFLGLDHQYGEGPPLLFETMAWIDTSNKREWLDLRPRCSTWDEAEKQHAEVVAQMLGMYPGTKEEKLND